MQKEGKVIHIICDPFTDQDDRLRRIGRTKLASRPFGDGVHNDDVLIRAI